ncbi:uncharacterized protein LOC121403791 [Drosophila obscura]|uniref:uncharacterized protein LOC121403791 n=1 Tax=Drosophila obscura TaxID=7282 RepID=UPI001BB25B67|nr:uncharacterized protein LOC121403791 [Drosophila obscura]
MDPRCPNTGYARPNKSSKLRASANKFRDSNESLPSPPGISRTTYKLCGTEQCSESVHRRMEEPGKLPSQIPQPKTNTFGAQRLTAATPELGRRKSRLRIVETQYQMLQGHQSDFLDALKSLGPQESRMLGTCQLVPLVLDADNKLVLQKDKDPISVPPNSLLFVSQPPTERKM